MTKKILIVYSGTRGGGVNDYLNLVQSSSDFDGLTLFNFGSGRYLLEKNDVSRLRYLSLYISLFVTIWKSHREYNAVLFVMCSPFNIFIPFMRLVFTTKCSIFYCCHNNLTFQDNISSIRDKLTKMFEVIGRLCAHRLLFFSENVFHKSNRFWSKKGLVIGFGYTELSAESDKSLHGFQDDDYWLFFGRATAYKGIDSLAKALPLIDKKINIVIASTGVTAAIKRQIEPHDNVTLIDRWITDPELCRLLNRSSGILLPYTDVSQSGPLYLAIGHRKPIIASNIPEFVILAKKITSIRLFLSGDSLDFANTINDHHPKVKKISIEAYNSIRSDCSWNVVAKRLMEIS